MQKKYEHVLAPTVNVLEKILNSHTVGLGALACEVKQYFPIEQNLAVSNQSRPYFVASVSISLKQGSNDIEGTIIYGKNISGIDIEENGSVLLEVQVAPKEGVTLKLVEYQWFMNGAPVPESKMHTGTKTPLLCVSKADLEMNGSKYSCSVTINCRETITVKDITLRVNCPLDQYSSSLASIYSAWPEVPEDTWPPMSNVKHINLALIKQGRVNYSAEYAHLTIRGDIDDNYRRDS